MPERYVKVPENIALVDDDDRPISVREDDGTEKPLVAEWSPIMLRFLSHPRLVNNVAALKSNNLLRRKIRHAKPGDVLGVPEDDWKRLASVLEDPDKVDDKGQQAGINVLSSLSGFAPKALPQLEEFFTAWTDAPSKPAA